MWTFLLRFLPHIRAAADWLEAKAGGQAAVDEAVAKGSRPLGVGKTFVAVVVLMPLVAPWLDALGFVGFNAAGDEAAKRLSDNDGALDYAHVALAVCLAAFGLRRAP